MYRIMAFIVVATLALGAPSAAATVQDIVNLISQSSFTDYLTNTIPTHIHDNRTTDIYGNSSNVNIPGPQHDSAAAAVLLAFRRSGWLTYYDPWTYHDDAGKAWSGRNIVAVKQGVTTPNNIYIVSSHYDSIANHETGAWTYAPGGDDNGSGTAGILEMARVMAPYSFNSTIVLVAFDGEEYGITVNGSSVARLGSMHYATSHASDNMLGMVSFDMISWNYNNTGRIETGFSQNAGINAAMTTALQTYGGLGVYTNNSSNYSDHVSFATLPSKVPAVMLIENNWPSNPNYHHQTDSIDTPNYIDYAYGTKMLKAVCGWVCGQAGVAGGP